MNKLIGTLFLTAPVLVPATAEAHPGAHPVDVAWSFAHAFSQPDHLLAMAAVIVWLIMAGCVAYWFKPWRKDSWSR